MRLMRAEGILGGGFGTQSSRNGEQIVAGFDEEGGGGTQSSEIRLDTSEPPDAKARQRDLAVRLSQATVADAVGLLMRSERHRHHSLADRRHRGMSSSGRDQGDVFSRRPTTDKRQQTR